MDDYISRQKAMDAAELIIGRDTSGKNAVVNAMIAWNEYIKGLPSEDVQPVRHGRWVFGQTMHHGWMKCSECCVSQTPTGTFSYCPNCGARMDGEQND